MLAFVIFPHSQCLRSESKNCFDDNYYAAPTFLLGNAAAEFQLAFCVRGELRISKCWPKEHEITQESEQWLARNDAKNTKNPLLEGGVRLVYLYIYIYVYVFRTIRSWINVTYKYVQH